LKERRGRYKEHFEFHSFSGEKNMRKTIIVGNWKMNKSPREARDFARELRSNLRTLPENREVGISPTLIALEGAIEEMKGSDIMVGAQAGHWEKTGAFTGLVAMEMIKDAGADFCLVGHSEQRQFFGETDETVNSRTKAALALGLRPIVCIGESLEERETGKMNDVLSQQIKEGLKDLKLDNPSDLILAYEPVWAIGTGKTATPEMAEEAHQFCRAELAKVLGEDAAQAISIQYGGSAKPENAAELLSKENIDGLLVGGASLKVDSFLAIINS
jgi:triosephosphate isomerase